MLLLFPYIPITPPALFTTTSRVEPIADHDPNSLGLQALTEEQLVRNGSTLIIAGSETTATLLSGAIFLLTTHPDKLAKLTDEVRSTFNSEEEITLNSVSRLTYMLACLNEALRCYPPVAPGLPRVVPKGGAYVAGKFVPEDVSASGTQAMGCCITCY